MMSDKNRKIDIILITGWLGSGKTTLLNNFLKNIDVKKNIGIIINDFGKIAIDAELIQINNKDIISNEKISITEITNGSIFCSCLESVFIDGLKYYSNIKPDLLFIETSGLSDPSGINKILAQLNGLKHLFNIIAKICVVDISNLLKLIDSVVVLRRQIESSDYILLNKIDIISKSEIKNIEDRVLSINPNAEIIQTSYANITLNKVINTSIENHSNENVKESCNMPSNRPSVILLQQIKITLDKLKFFFTLINDKILRIKGFFKINGITYFITNNNNMIYIEKSDYENPKNLGITILCLKDNERYIIDKWDKLNYERVKVS